MSSGFRSAASSFGAADSARPSPMSSPWDTPLATPFESPATTPGGSPAQRPFDKNRIPRAEDIHMILSDGESLLLQDPTRRHPFHRQARAPPDYQERDPLHPRNPPRDPYHPGHGQATAVVDLVQQLGVEEWPAACMHGAIIYDKDRNVEQSMSLDPHFVRDVSRLMRQHNKSTFLYVADSVAMVSKEEGGSKDWEQVTRGFDPVVNDERDTDFMKRVLKGKEKIGKVNVPPHGRGARSGVRRTDREVVPRGRLQDHSCPPLHHRDRCRGCRQVGCARLLLRQVQHQARKRYHVRRRRERVSAVCSRHPATRSTWPMPWRSPVSPRSTPLARISAFYPFLFRRSLDESTDQPFLLQRGRRGPVPRQDLPPRAGRSGRRTGRRAPQAARPVARDLFSPRLGRLPLNLLSPHMYIVTTSRPMSIQAT
ncbi:SPOSA6832_01956, partial [Sporobolomyces salmonicolor]